MVQAEDGSKTRVIVEGYKKRSSFQAEYLRKGCCEHYYIRGIMNFKVVKELRSKK